MHTPAEKTKHQHSGQAAQFQAASQTAITDNRSEMAQLQANQTLMGASRQQQELQAVQVRMARSSQLKMKPGLRSQNAMQSASVAATSQRVAQLSKLTWTNGKWVSDSDSSASSAKVPKPEGDFEGQVFDDVTGTYTEEDGVESMFESADGKKEEGEREEGKKEEEPKADPVPGLINVGIAAGKHIWGVAMIGGNEPNPGSFSFAKASTINTDTALINNYLKGNAVAGVNVAILGGNKYRITVIRGGQTRIYEVHKDHSLQAFPVSGDGVVNNLNAGCDLKGIKEVVKKTRGRLDLLTPAKMQPWHTNANRINAIISLGN